METNNPDKSIAGRLNWAITLTAVTLVAEILGGIWTNSLALLSDAAHVFLDLFALVLSLAAIKLSALPPTNTRTYGWHRAEIFASFINGLTVFLIAIAIFTGAWGRLLKPEAVNSLPMFLIAFIGLVMNLLAAFVLQQHAQEDLNVRSAFLHVMSDAAASVGVIIGGVVMYYYQWYILDAVISIGIGCIVFCGAWRVLRESTHILLEGVPRGLKIADVADSIRSVTGVKNIHHLNIWSICSHITALSAHVDIDSQVRQGGQAEVIHDIENMLREKFSIAHTTLQAECIACAAGPVIKELSHASHANPNPHIAGRTNAHRGS
jgi:cobalt-zinc-cadmium efflux system protein